MSYFKPDLSTLSGTLEAMKAHASTICVSTIPIPKLGCGLDRIKWQEVVKLFCDFFGYTHVQIVVYSLDEIGVQTMSTDGDAEF